MHLRKSFRLNMLLGSLILGSTVLAQTGGPIEKAQQLIAQKKYKEVIALLKPDENKTGQAWLLLGRAYRGERRLPETIAALEQATTFPVTKNTAITFLFRLHAGTKNADAAHKWYQRARRTPRLTQPNFAVLPEVANLKEDDRFADLFPEKVSYDRPFVENVEIIHEWRGEKAGDEFGWEARTLGDVDGDNIWDVVISAPAHPPFGDTHGLVYVYSGKSGKLLWKKRGEKGAQLGKAIETAYDVNKDGIPDVVVGAGGANTVYVYSGRNGETLLTVKGDPEDRDMGSKVAGIGDFNGDGYGDILAGAPSSNVAGTGAGRAHVFSGKDGSRLLTLDGEKAGAALGSATAGLPGERFALGAGGAGPKSQGRVYVYDKLSEKPLYTLDPHRDSGVSLGYMFCSFLGDVNKDGVADIYASDWLDNSKGPMTGRVYIVSGKDGQALYHIDGETAGEGLGTSPSVAGDINRDGYADLAVGAWQYSKAAWSGGRIYVFSGKDGSKLYTVTSRIPGETLGFDSVHTGDINGDGFNDLLVTSAWSMVNGHRSGRAYILSGKPKK